ncbi:BNR repeat domain protein [Archangium gephyra]|uniref:BNR repeat domain protein n=1 Tax=Archangium gephyra TaxID=48 RepID=A0AAC8TBA9_9BACT|nr:BNR repeat domain protein [Archangium gephyra]
MKKKWAGLLGTLLLAACGAPDPAAPGVGEELPGVARAPITDTISAAYDSTLKAFKCDGLTWNCDPYKYLDGRGQVITEYYAPSTLGGTCLDGELGSYMDDEWISKVRVFTEDQTPLTQGRPASIEVTVQMPVTPQANFLDLYASSSVTSPSWTLLTTLTPTGAARSLQTLKATFTVPAGSKVQAVRAALRRGGTASPCTLGGYDDRDDLVFTPAPPYVSGAKATSVASGSMHSLALRADGTLWGWGDNYSSQLGAGASMYVSTLPVQATLLSGVKSVHATSDSSLALRTDGTVWAWGGNSTGVLGNGTTTTSANPVQVSGLTSVTALAAGRSHVLALRSDGTVWAWGDNSRGQLGDGTRINRTRPVRVGTLTGVTALAAGRNHSLVLRNDGTVWTWGDNSMGCLGNGTTIASSVPIKVAAMTGVTSIAASDSFSLAIRGTRELWGWGFGPLGDALGSHHPTPARTYLWSTGTFSVFAGPAHAVALERTQGTAWSWGDFNFQPNCTSPTVNYGALPAPISGLTGVSGVSIGERYAQVFLLDGTVWGWGDGVIYQKGTDQGGTGNCAPLKVALP